METTFTTSGENGGYWGGNGYGNGYNSHYDFDLLQKTVTDGQAGIIDKITANSLAESKDRSDIAQRSSAALNSVERDIQNRVHENRMILIKEVHDQADKVNLNVTTGILEVKNQLRDFQIDSANKFSIAQLEAAKNAAASALEGAKNTAAILAQLTGDKYDNMKDKIDELRFENERGKWMSAFAVQSNEVANFKNMLNSIEQTQKFASKTVQFGTGNLAGTAQTANQG